jgi:hypothetical protein
MMNRTEAAESQSAGRWPIVLRHSLIQTSRKPSPGYQTARRVALIERMDLENIVHGEPGS